MKPDINRAAQLHQQGQLDAAEAIYRNILKRNPKDFDSLHLLGVLKQQRGELQEARGYFERALAIEKNSAPALSNYGCLLLALDRPQDALPLLERAIEIFPGFANALNNRANALNRLHRCKAALESADRALTIQPRHADALANRAGALLGLRRFDEALASADAALAIDPDNIEALNNRACALMEFDRHDEAADNLARLLQLRPDSIGGLNNLGNLFQQLGRVADSIDCYERALESAPQHPNLNFNSAVGRLCLGDFTEGWRRYEWRWKNPLFMSRKRDFATPLWLGEFPIEGKTILLHAEQGLGDTLQFIRYVPRVAELGANVIIEVQNSLLPLVSGMREISTLVSEDEALPAFDCHCPLMSLPLAFRTGLSTIPADVPYITAPADRIAGWAKRLAGHDPLRVGIAWSGSAAHKQDRKRSIPLSLLSGLMAEPGIRLFSLQRDVKAEDAVTLAEFGDVVHLGADLQDFADTAAVVSQLDLVVSVDTAVAHLAGAMGKPVWIFVPFSPDFRWLLDRSDSPWYPSAVLFRQTRIGDWSKPISLAADRLRSMAKERLPGTMQRRA
jgi:tetratricopeptide (TPR) repeat protein